MIKTEQEAEAMLERIRNAAGDDEVAHGLEDDLWEGVLEAIAANFCEDPRSVAATALQSRQIKFERWRA